MARGSTCVKCGGRVEQGFTLDHADGGGKAVAAWVEGVPVKKWYGLKHSKRKLQIETWRCTKCGFLENYAPG
jgi:hypothetical protein